jgi:hypothetical protein
MKIGQSFACETIKLAILDVVVDFGVEAACLEPVKPNAELREFIRRELDNGFLDIILKI